jgi:hypothetical protein
MPWVSVALLEHGQRIVHVSVWRIFDQPQQLVSCWLVDPKSLDREEQLLLRDGSDMPFDPQQRDEVVAAIAEALAESMPLYLSSRQQGLLAYYCSLAGELLSDEGMLMSQLMRAVSIKVPRAPQLEDYYQALMGRSPLKSTAAQRGELMAQMVEELVERLEQQGIETAAQLEERRCQELFSFDFSSKAFSQDDVLGLPDVPGVYGFKDKSGTYIYIGKAQSLKKRVVRYFRKSEESPRKLEQLREQAYQLTTHLCGSELETLIYEYRLINKYQPSLNSHIQIAERQGTWRTLEDSVVLLPHVQPTRGMAVLFRKGQKIMLRPFAADFSDGAALTSELKDFFFDSPTPAAPSDFPEQEIALRWIQRHRDSLIIIAVHQLSSAEEVVEAMQSYWSEVM